MSRREQKLSKTICCQRAIYLTNAFEIWNIEGSEQLFTIPICDPAQSTSLKSRRGERVHGELRIFREA